MSATARKPILASGHRSRPGVRRSRTLLALRLLAIPATVAVVVFGVWLTGAAITNDFAVAMWLSVAWMAFAGLLALVIAARSRALDASNSLLLPPSSDRCSGRTPSPRWAIGALLGSSIFMDNVVNEQVATAAPPAAPAAAPARPRKARSPQNVLLCSGRLVSKGPATSEDDVDDFVDLGGLKGNKGNQQYEISADVDLRRYSTAVIWCRAFSVLFALAPLPVPR
jgi:hypothetical protein